MGGGGGGWITGVVDYKIGPPRGTMNHHFYGLDVDILITALIII